MNRRQFLTRVSTGLVGAAVATRVPVKWLPAPVQRFAALEYMRLHVNNRLHEDITWNIAHRNHPRREVGGIIVSPWLYAHVEDEMIACCRLSDSPLYMMPRVPMPHVLFKGFPVISNPQVADPREVHLLTVDEWARHLGAGDGPRGQM